jgi:hypothetical protein
MLPAQNLNIKDVEREIMGPHLDHDHSRRPPEDVAQGLRNIKPTMRLLFNRRGKLLVNQSGSYDANGEPRALVYEPRWELWDTDAGGHDYMVMVLRDADDNWREPGMWLAERMARFNMARFRGPQEWAAYVNAYNEKHREMHEGDWSGFLDFAADYCWRMAHPIAHPYHYNPR